MNYAIYAQEVDGLFILFYFIFVFGLKEVDGFKGKTFQKDSLLFHKQKRLLFC